MKTTIDVPDELLRRIESHAAHRQQRLNDAVTELLLKGLESPNEASVSLPRPVVKADSKSGLPYIDCPHAARAADEMTPERVANILLGEEASWHQ